MEEEASYVEGTACVGQVASSESGQLSLWSLDHLFDLGMDTDTRTHTKMSAFSDPYYTAYHIVSLGSKRTYFDNIVRGPMVHNVTLCLSVLVMLSLHSIRLYWIICDLSSCIYSISPLQHWCKKLTFIGLPFWPLQMYPGPVCNPLIHQRLAQLLHTILFFLNILTWTAAPMSCSNHEDCHFHHNDPIRCGPFWSYKLVRRSFKWSFQMIKKRN